jgi:hypothetical protein
MWKAILAGAAALAIAGTSFVYAQQRDHGPARWRSHGADHPVNRGLSQEDATAFTDARIAGLKAGLRLNPDQDKLWPAYETALRDIAKAHLERRASRQGEPRPTDPVERLRRQGEALTAAGANLTRLADAQDPLYQSLDDGQKRRFQRLSHMMRHHARFAGMQQRRGHERRGGQHGPRGGEGGPNYKL